MKRVLLALALLTPACGDEYVDQAETCTVLGGLIAEYLAVDLDCTLQFEFLVDFAVSCGGNAPTVQEAWVCLGAVYALDECPNFLPSECLLFSDRLQVTVPEGSRP